MGDILDVIDALDAWLDARTQERMFTGNPDLKQEARERLRIARNKLAVALHGLSRASDARSTDE